MEASETEFEVAPRFGTLKGVSEAVKGIEDMSDTECTEYLCPKCSRRVIFEKPRNGANGQCPFCNGYFRCWIDGFSLADLIRNRHITHAWSRPSYAIKKKYPNVPAFPSLWQYHRSPSKDEWLRAGDSDDPAGAIEEMYSRYHVPGSELEDLKRYKSQVEAWYAQYGIWKDLADKWNAGNPDDMISFKDLDLPRPMPSWVFQKYGEHDWGILGAKKSKAAEGAGGRPLPTISVTIT